MSEKIIQLNEGAIKQELGEMVRQSVENTLNALLDEEADRLTNATRYERSEDRLDTRAGHYKRKLLTKAGEVELKMPRLRTLPFETAIIQRYQKREISVEEALVEMYLAGVSVRRVEDITEALWGTKVSAGTVSQLNQKVYVKIEEWRQRPLLTGYPYVYLDGIYLKCVMSIGYPGKNHQEFPGFITELPGKNHDLVVAVCRMSACVMR